MRFYKVEMGQGLHTNTGVNNVRFGVVTSSLSRCTFIGILGKKGLGAYHLPSGEIDNKEIWGVLTTISKAIQPIEVILATAMKMDAMGGSDWQDIAKLTDYFKKVYKVDVSKKAVASPTFRFNKSHDKKIELINKSVDIETKKGVDLSNFDNKTFIYEGFSVVGKNLMKMNKY